MFYRKYYEGSISNATDTLDVKKYYGVASTVKCYINQTDVLNNALKDILTKCGMSVTYDRTNGYLWCDGIPLSIYFTSNSAYSIFIPFKTDALTSASSQYVPFNGLDYKFYVTVKGDPGSILDVYIGNYASAGTVNASYSFSICKGTNLKDNANLIGVSKAKDTTMYMYKLKTSAVELLYTGATTPTAFAIGFTITNDAELSEQGQTIPLIDNIFANGFLRIKNAYLGYAGLTNDNFYNIGGDIYYKRDNFTLVKCTKTVS